jgi:hypothetical protein
MNLEIQKKSISRSLLKGMRDSRTRPTLHMRQRGILFLSVFTILFQSCHNCRDEYERTFRYTKFDGIVKDAYFDSKYRGAPVIELINGANHYIASNYLICFAKAGDSISKKSNSLKYTLYTDKDSINFYPECEEGLIDVDTLISYDNMSYSKNNKGVDCQFEKRK